MSKLEQTDGPILEIDRLSISFSPGCAKSRR